MLLVAAGCTHKETSSRMGCSERKIERLLASARDRCGAKSTPHLMAVLNLAGFGHGQPTDQAVTIREDAR